MGKSFAVIGAGPYGLAVAAHLRAAGREVRIFGKSMDFWDSQMPKGMWLRSPWNGSNIADPERILTLDQYQADQGSPLVRPLPVEDFVRYGRWFQRRSLPDLDPRNVVSVERAEGGFRLALEDGESLGVECVVVATGIGSFAHQPVPFASLPAELVSHTSARINRDLGRFAGKRVMVVGGGQSAVESAALLSEAGADVEVLVRQPHMRWLRLESVLPTMMDSKLNPFRAPGKIGAPPINWLIEHPALFTMLPRRLQSWLAVRAIGPAASGWLRPRTQQIAFKTGSHAVAADAHGGKIRLQLNDGTSREADHVLLGTGYKIDIARYGFLSPELLQGVRTVNGYPVLNRGFESSLPGLYFVGATGAHSFGPLCRFVVGTQYAARALTNFVRKAPAPRLLATAQA
jgi:cation diffusion facilitator CzcD-associated flavoprotein CzcO